MLIDPNKVEEVFKDCLFGENVKPKSYIPVEGILHRYGLDPEKINQHYDTISNWLDSLPDDFQQHKGGGMSFLRSCEDKEGTQWTGLHQRMEQLFVLGMAAGRVVSTLPKIMWGVLPGGMPYFTVKENRTEVESVPYHEEF